MTTPFFVRSTAPRAADRTKNGGEPAPPWPGQVPAPAPAAVVAEPQVVEVVDAGGAPVRVNGRGVATGDPARIRLGGQQGWLDVVGWAGPWPVEERWWDPVRARRRARLQVVDAQGVARLLALEDGRWWVLAVYD